MKDYCGRRMIQRHPNAKGEAVINTLGQEARSPPSVEAMFPSKVASPLTIVSSPLVITIAPSRSDIQQNTIGELVHIEGTYSLLNAMKPTDRRYLSVHVATIPTSAMGTL